MNIAAIIAVIKLILENKESIVELIKLIQSLLAASNLIGENGEATVVEDSGQYPLLATAVQTAGMSWSEFVKLLIENSAAIKEVVKALSELIEKLKN